MKIIRNNYIFNRLMTVAGLGMRNGFGLWMCIFDDNGKLLDENIPALAGGIDKIIVTPNQIEFHDIGSNVDGFLRDNSFAIRKRL